LTVNDVADVAGFLTLSTFNAKGKAESGYGSPFGGPDGGFLGAASRMWTCRADSITYSSFHMWFDAQIAGDAPYDHTQVARRGVAVAIQNAVKRFLTQAGLARKPFVFVMLQHPAGIIQYHEMGSGVAGLPALGQPRHISEPVAFSGRFCDGSSEGV
jgi:hypothetical protein